MVRIYTVCMESYYIFTYQPRKTESRHTVPCGNEKICWNEVASGWKKLLDLTTNTLQQKGIGCLPIEYGPTKTWIKICPIGSYQWKRSRWKCYRRETGERRPEGNISIGIHLHMWIDDKRKVITTLSTTQYP